MAIPSNLKDPFDIFVSKFYITIYVLGETYKMPSLDIFCDQSTHDKENILHMGTLDRSYK